MKKLLLPIACLGLLTPVSFAQEKEENREMHVVIKTKEDGKTKVDTVINLDDLESKIESINLDSLIEAVGLALAESWVEVSDELKNVNLDIVINGEEVEMDGIEDAAKWVGDLMEDVTVEFFENENHIFISSTDKGTKKMRIIVDESSGSGSTVHEEFIDIDLDLDDNGNGSIIVKSISDNGDD